ncbi:MAG TPA: SDR family NAD(P)-dependent oxidoreductase, partial [Chloroflexaceae bacterium]|nr:SDR family NAD(P)-dependent oxidoreductase [Chloroflexaceae bacterium]
TPAYGGNILGVETLTRAVTALNNEGHDAHAIVCDVTDRAQVEHMVAEVTARLGPIDLLVANAVSAVTVGPVVAQTVEDLEEVHAALYWGVVYPIMALLPQMRARRGRIVVVASIGGKVPVPHMAGYSAAKHAAVGFAGALRAELAGSGVSVTTVAPGILRTGAHLHQRYAGRAVEELTWFARGELAPVVSIPAGRAARLIVAAAAARAGEVAFPGWTALAARLYGLFPNGMGALLALANRMLPAPPAGPPERGYGAMLQEQADDPLLRHMAARYEPVLRRLNQCPEPPAHGEAAEARP